MLGRLCGVVALACLCSSWEVAAQDLRCSACAVTSALSPDGASVESAGPEASPDSPSIYDVADPPLSPFTGNETAAPPNLALAPTIEEAYVESLEFGAPNVEYWNTEIGQFVNATSVGFANTTNSSSVEASTTLIGRGVSNGYSLPSSKQGINDQRYFTAAKITSGWATERAARYKAFKAQINPGVRRYNVFWHVFEGGTVQPSSDPNLKCDAGYIKVPKDEAARTAAGINKYHCYAYAHINDLDSYLALDAANGIESAAIIWGAPAWARNAKCLGDPKTGKVPCAPRADALWAWQDFSAFLASRWQGGKQGRFAHYIVWNEADSPAWFDLSPEANDILKHVENTQAGNIIIQRMANMMYLTHSAIKNNQKGKPALVYVSIDRMWTASPWCPGPRWGNRCPLGAVNLLNGLWHVLGIKIDWSVAVHAYGDPLKTNWQLNEPYKAYTFADLPNVRDYQLAKLRAAKAPYPTLAPQAMMAATEQGWSTDTDKNTLTAAKNICASHAIATQAGSNIVWVAHNDMQDVYSPYTGSYGLIPKSSGDVLSKVNGQTPSGLAAYQSTNVKNWGRNNGHYCCTAFQIGCKP